MPTIASKDYLAGEVITTCHPFLHVIDTRCIGKVCQHCLIEKVTWKCQRCTYSYYCGEDCLLKDFENHKYECQFMARCNQTYLSMDSFSRLLLRLHWKKMNEKQWQTTCKRKYLLHNERSKCVNDLVCAVDEIKTNKTQMTHFGKICTQFFSLGIKFSTEQLLALFGLVRMNAYVLNRDDLMSFPIAYAILIERSVFTHACNPNAAMVCNGRNVEIRAMADIKRGQDMTIARVDTCLPKFQRQNALKENLNIDCTCSRCSHEGVCDQDYSPLAQMQAITIFNLKSYHNLLRKSIFPILLSGINFMDIEDSIRKVFPNYSSTKTIFLLCLLCQKIGLKMKGEQGVDEKEIRERYEDVRENAKITHHQESPLCMFLTQVRKHYVNNEKKQVMNLISQLINLDEIVYD